MKKIFRFQYEPCTGTCYTGGNDFYQELKKADTNKLNSIINNIVKAHDSTCDDLDQRFGVDYDEENKIFIGTFLNGRRLDMFSDKSFLNLVDTLSNHVLNENKNKLIKEEGCVFGINGNENLAELILKSVAA